MAVSGVRSSWLTVEMNSVFICSMRRRRETSTATVTTWQVRAEMRSGRLTT